MLLTGFDLPGYENEARRIGAYGFISKEVGIEELVNTIKMIMQGETVFPTKRIWLEELTEKEREILELYCHGHSRKDITYILGISMRTLANHLNVIYEKLDVSNYQEMVQKAIRMGYLLPKGKNKMEKYYEIDEAVLMNSIHDITEVELKELISDENMYIRTMTNVCPTSFLTCC